MKYALQKGAMISPMNPQSERSTSRNSLAGAVGSVRESDSPAADEPVNSDLHRDQGEEAGTYYQQTKNSVPL